MSNTEWKNGYDAGFAAGWKAAKADTPNYTTFPSIYHGPSVYHGISPTPHFSTMADQSPYHVNTTTVMQLLH